MIKNEYADMLNRTADGNLSSLHKSRKKSMLLIPKILTSDFIFTHKKENPHHNKIMFICKKIRLQRNEINK